MKHEYRYPRYLVSVAVLDFFAYYFVKVPVAVHLHHSSQIKVIKKSQNSRNQGFSFYVFVLDNGRIGIRSSDTRIREGQKLTDPMDPDPEHWW